MPSVSGYFPDSQSRELFSVILSRANCLKNVLDQAADKLWEIHLLDQRAELLHSLPNGAGLEVLPDLAGRLGKPLFCLVDGVRLSRCQGREGCAVRLGDVGADFDHTGGDLLLFFGCQRFERRHRHEQIVDGKAHRIQRLPIR
jgi:hypothetical protein